LRLANVQHGSGSMYKNNISDVGSNNRIMKRILKTVKSCSKIWLAFSPEGPHINPSIGLDMVLCQPNTGFGCRSDQSLHRVIQLHQDLDVEGQAGHPVM